MLAGQGTVALEILDQNPALDAVLVAIGGGGLITGMAVALKALKPSISIIGIEPTGSPTFHASLKAGKVVALDRVTTRVATMACAKTEPAVFELSRHAIDEIVLVDDDEMLDASRWLWFELGLAADLSGAAAGRGAEDRQAETRARAQCLRAGLRRRSRSPGWLIRSACRVPRLIPHPIHDL